MGKTIRREAPEEKREDSRGNVKPHSVQFTEEMEASCEYADFVHAVKHTPVETWDDETVLKLVKMIETADHLKFRDC